MKFFLRFSLAPLASWRFILPGFNTFGALAVIAAGVLATKGPGAAAPFAFESRVVPRWKYW